MLHRIWQKHHISPDEIYNKPDGVKKFIYASEAVVIDQEEKDRKKMKNKK